MIKKQKILAIATLGLVLFSLALATSRVFASDITPTGGEPSISNQIKGNSTLGSGVTPTETKPSGVGLIFGAINAFIGFIGGGLFSLAGGLTNYALLLNFDIFNNPMIDVGWGIARDLANLGFVLLIIIIAIATILRIQQYGAKSALGTLIAVALLVNFSLFFAGIFINFSNMLTNYFIKSITANNDIGGLGPSLAGAFRIQNLLDVKNATEMGAMQGVTQFGKSMLIGVASSFFVAAFTLIGAFSLLTLAIMFMVRYLALSILLILVPLAFLFIILPDTRKLWTQWISEFMKWIIFAPTASFFLYLAVYMTVNYGKMLDNLAAQSQDIGTANQMSFANLTINQPLQTIGRMLIIIGLLLGGLVVANSTGAMGAKYGIAAANAAGRWIRGGAARLGKAPFSTQWGQKITEGMQKTGANRGFGGWMARRTIAPLGTALSGIGIQDRERQLKQAEERVNKITSDKQVALQIATMGQDEKIVALSRLAKNKTLDLVPNLASYIRDARTKQVWEQYGQGKAYGDLETAAMFNRDMLVGSEAERQAAAQKFFAKKGKNDWGKMQFNEMFGEWDAKKPQFGLNQVDHELLQKLATYGIATNNAGDIRKLITGIKPENFNQTIKVIRETQKTNPQLALNIEEALKKTLAYRATGELFEFTGTTTPTS